MRDLAKLSRTAGLTVPTADAFEYRVSPAEGGASRRHKRAAQLFVFEDLGLSSAFVDRVWRTRTAPAASFISVAQSHWGMVVTRQRGRSFLTLRGPETKASVARIPDDAEFIGIEFTPGTFMPSLPVDQLVQSGSLTFPELHWRRSFWLDDSPWEFPDFDTADTFVDRLVRAGLLVRDPVVTAALRGEVHELSPRSLQRRIRRSTGLTRTAIKQIARAERAVGMLDRGVAILDTVEQAGYADQAHLTRSLKRFVGQTPAEIVQLRASA